jgi:hypothetical protein
MIQIDLWAVRARGMLDGPYSRRFRPLQWSVLNQPAEPARGSRACLLRLDGRAQPDSELLLSERCFKLKTDFELIVGQTIQKGHQNHQSRASAPDGSGATKAQPPAPALAQKKTRGQKLMKDQSSKATPLRRFVSEPTSGSKADEEPKGKIHRVDPKFAS